MQNQLEISHLVVNGCSFTYCQGLDKPHEQGWPAILSRLLNVPVVNLAMGGSGNDSICRRTYEYFYKDHKDSKPFYIIALSGSARREEFYTKYQDKDVNDFINMRLMFPENEPPEDYEYEHIVHMNYNIRERLKLLYASQIVNLLKANKINYFTTDFMPTRDIDVLNYINKYHKGLSDNFYKDENKILNFTQIVRRLQPLPCGHVAEMGNIAIANYIYEKLLERYKKIIPVESPYLKLMDFYEQTTLSRYDFHHWIYEYVFTKQV